MKTFFSSLRGVSMAASSAVLALLVVPGAAHAEIGQEPGATQTATSASVQCGFYRYKIRESQFAGYNHCGSTTVRVHVDVAGGGSGNDYHLCVSPGAKDFPGAGPNYLNAYYIGGAGCPSGQKTAHTPH
ncbi:DUF6355 family natural product biosynthesis protein [Streptomyces microflavus]|uniref:DUF6355 family natural product biosynthesis protein n=1 Tax=Streptomyces microflavus TaxID=1919 RepID=UPI0033B6D027